MFPYEIKQKAIELSKTRSAGQTLEALRRIPEFKGEDMPDERTINRWRNEAKRQQSQAAESAETAGKTPRERLITSDGLYEKIMDIPPWARKPPR